MENLVNYLMWGIHHTKNGIVAGCICYGIVFACLCLKKDRRKIRIQNLYEMLICIWLATVFLIIGMIPVHINPDVFAKHTVNLNLITFYGGAFVPMVLNVMMFMPIGLLLPLAFTQRINGKKALLIGGGISFVIEIVQIFAGRNAEIDDLLLNSAGALLGYSLYDAGRYIRVSKKKCVQKLCIFCMTVLVGSGGIWLLCDHDASDEDGIFAVKDEIETIRFIHDGEEIEGDIDSEEFLVFSDQLSNCGGHIFEVKDISDHDVINRTDYFIEVEFKTPQTIFFQNVEEFVIHDAGRMLYNLNSNELFWGSDSYQKSVDYTNMDKSLEDYRGEILSNYDQLKEMIIVLFHRRG